MTVAAVHATFSHVKPLLSSNLLMKRNHLRSLTAVGAVCVAHQTRARCSFYTRLRRRQN